MQRVILDTNVIVSALISNSYPTKILHEIIFERKVVLCLSNEIIKEYINVLNRPKFERFHNFKNNAEGKYQPGTLIAGGNAVTSLGVNPAIKLQ